MAEKRIPLTDTQFKAIVSANLKVERARQEAADAQAYMATVSGLVLDAHELPVDAKVRIDEKTKELIVLG